MMMIKSPQEIEILKKCNQLLAEVREELRTFVKPGISTMDIDAHFTKLITDRGMKPAFKGYRGYPCNICISINDEVVHGIPSQKRILKDGDIVGLDMGAVYQGFYGDTAITLPVGKVSEAAKKLMQVTEASLYKGIEAAQPGNHVGDIGAAVQEYCESHGFSVVREFVGHGIGRALHEDPQVPNYGKRGTGAKLVPGLVIAIEPMINQGSPQVRILEDGWTAVTEDGKLSAHFEHSIAITEQGPVILSSVN